MSSTNRGGERREDDVYITPAWAVRALLADVEISGGWWLEPCAGDGAIIQAVATCRTDVEWSAFELRSECGPALLESPRTHGVVVGYDFLADFVPGRHYDAIVTNPPYSLAEEFIRACLPLADVVVMLLRLNFLGSMKRAAFLREYAPSVYVLPKRPSFVGGKTDSCEYAWFVWRKYWAGSPEVRVLNPENCRGVML